MESNKIIKKAFSVSDNDEYPPALESIAIQLGFDRTSPITLPQVLSEIAESLNK